MKENQMKLNLKQEFVKIGKANHKSVIAGEGVLCPHLYLGGAGIGKTAQALQAGAELAQWHVEQGNIESVQDFQVILVAAATHDSYEIKGAPKIGENKHGVEVLHYIPNGDFMPESKNGYAMVIIDEVTSCSEDVQLALFSMVNERKLGRHSLSDNTVIVLLGNREIDGNTYRPKLAPFQNRLVQFEVDLCPQSWLNFGIENKYHQAVLSFIAGDTNQLSEKATKDKPFATPRSWHNVSKMLKARGDDFLNEKGGLSDFGYIMVQGAVGFDKAENFKQYINELVELPPVEELLSGEKAFPNEMTKALAYASKFYSYVHDGANEEEQTARLVKLMDLFKNYFDNDKKLKINSELLIGVFIQFIKFYPNGIENKIVFSKELSKVLGIEKVNAALTNATKLK